MSKLRIKIGTDESIYREKMDIEVEINADALDDITKKLISLNVAALDDFFSDTTTPPGITFNTPQGAEIIK